MTSVIYSHLDAYIGHDRVRNSLRVAIDAARERGDRLDHTLFHGPTGLGQSELAQALAAEMGVSLRVTSGPAIERDGDLISLLTNLKADDVLFIDEIHRLARQVEEVLYSAMEDYAVDIIIGKGPSARSMRISLPRFTLVGATTRLALLTSPFRDRFGIIHRLDLYDDRAMLGLVLRSGEQLGVVISDEGAREIVRWSCGEFSTARRLLKQARDYAQVRGEGLIDGSSVGTMARQLGLTQPILRSAEGAITTFLEDDVSPTHAPSAHASTMRLKSPAGIVALSAA